MTEVHPAYGLQNITKALYTVVKKPDPYCIFK